MRTNGLDERFFAFVLATMIVSIALTIAVWSSGFLLLGKPDVAGTIVTIGMVGVVMVLGPMLLIGLVPSALVFALVYRATGGADALPISAEYAGVATAAVASLFCTALLWAVNGDGAEIVVASVGAAAVLIAAFVARWTCQRPCQRGER